MKPKSLGGNQKDLYFVAVKVFLKKDRKLLITKDKYGDWDVPGGRIRRNEFNIPLEKVVARKMKEELGRGVRYRLGKPVIFMRHERREVSLGSPKVRIFAIGYEASLLDGSVALSDMHTQYKWVDIRKFEPHRYFKGGWLKGIQEYKQLRLHL